jgi:hypothetical protein
MLKKIVSRDSGFKELKNYMELFKFTGIPYTGFYLTNLTFIHEGNSQLDGMLIK